MQQAGLLRVVFSGVRVMDLGGLRHFEGVPPAAAPMHHGLFGSPLPRAEASPPMLQFGLQLHFPIFRKPQVQFGTDLRPPALEKLFEGAIKSICGLEMRCRATVDGGALDRCGAPAGLRRAGIEVGERALVAVHHPHRHRQRAVAHR